MIVMLHKTQQIMSWYKELSEASAAELMAWCILR